MLIKCLKIGLFKKPNYEINNTLTEINTYYSPTEFSA